jgi:hypothetical protein
MQLGAGQVTITAGAGVTLRSSGSKLKLKTSIRLQLAPRLLRYLGGCRQLVGIGHANFAGVGVAGDPITVDYLVVAGGGGL